MFDVIVQYLSKDRVALIFLTKFFDGFLVVSVGERLLRLRLDRMNAREEHGGLWRFENSFSELGQFLFQSIFQFIEF